MIDSLNSTASILDGFHGPLGIESPRESLSATPWREALKDSEQRITAAKEAAQKAAIGVAALGAVVVPIVMAFTKNGPGPKA